MSVPVSRDAKKGDLLVRSGMKRLPPTLTPMQQFIKAVQASRVPWAVKLILSKSPKTTAHSEESALSIKQKQHIYDMFVRFAKDRVHEENIEFIVALNMAQKEFDSGDDHGRCGEFLRYIFEHYINPETATKQINIHHTLRKAIIAAADEEGGFPPGNNPGAGLWEDVRASMRLALMRELNAFWREKAVDLQKVMRTWKERAADIPGAMLKSAKAKVKSVTSSADTATAHAEYHNDGYYNYDSVDNSELGYLRDGGRGYIGHGSGAFDGEGGQGVMDPSMVIIIFLTTIFMCLLCVVFTSIASCICGYWAQWFKEELVSMSVKERERDYVCEEV